MSKRNRHPAHAYMFVVLFRLKSVFEMLRIPSSTREYNIDLKLGLKVCVRKQICMWATCPLLRL